MNLNFDPGAVTPGGKDAAPGAQPKKRGRPPAPVWQYFTGVGEINASTKRRPAQCNFCLSTIDSRVEALLKHLVRDCPKATPDVRNFAELELQNRQSNQGEAHGTPQSKQKALIAKQRPGQAVDAVAAKSQPESSGLVDARQLRLLLLLDLPLSVADCQPFHDFVRSLRGKASVADATRLRNTVVPEECTRVQSTICKRVALETCVTVAVSNTVCVGVQHVLGCSVILPDKSALLLQAMEVPSDMYPAASLSGVIKDTISHFGSDRVAALVGPDGHQGLLSAMQQLTTSESHTHIIELRCHAHALCEFMTTVMGQPFAKGLLMEAHRLVLVISADTELLPVIFHALGATTSSAALPKMTESFFSVLPCLAALFRLEPAFRLLLQHNTISIPNSDVNRMLMTFNFINLGYLLEILEQCNRALIMIEQRKGCLADLTRAWLYIARTLEVLKAKVPSAFMDSCEAAYLKQVTKFDVDMCRLALFLDPRYKHAADTGGRFPKLLQKAVDIMKRRGHGKEECQQLISQMQAYKAGMSPYDLPGAWEQFNLQAWWLSLMSPATQVLVGLSLLMVEIAPFAAYPSQVLPALGWFSKSPRENLQGSFGTKLAVLKSYYENEGSLSFSETGMVIKPEGGGVAKSGEKAWEFPPAQISADELAVVLQQWKARSGDSRPSGALPSLFAAWEGIDVHSPLLDPTYTPQGNPAPQTIGGLGSFTDNDFDAAQLVQQYTMGQA